MWDGLAMIHKFKLSYYLIVGCVSVCIPALPNHLCAVPLLDPQIQTDTPPDNRREPGCATASETVAAESPCSVTKPCRGALFVP